MKRYEPKRWLAQAKVRKDVAELKLDAPEPGGKEILEGQACFMTELHSAVQAAVKQGKKLDDIVKKQRQAGFDQHPVVCRREELGGDGLSDQVGDTYDEITQHKPNGDIPH